MGRRAGRAFLRFDYSGHGVSEGRFEDGTISRWLEDGLAVIALAGRERLSWWAPRWAAGSRCSSPANSVRAAQSTAAGLVLIAPAAGFH